MRNYFIGSQGNTNDNVDNDAELSALAPSGANDYFRMTEPFTSGIIEFEVGTYIYDANGFIVETIPEKDFI